MNPVISYPFITINCKWFACSMLGKKSNKFSQMVVQKGAGFPWYNPQQKHQQKQIHTNPRMAREMSLTLNFTMCHLSPPVIFTVRTAETNHHWISPRQPSRGNQEAVRRKPLQYSKHPPAWLPPLKLVSMVSTRGSYKLFHLLTNGIYIYILGL